MEMKGYGSNYSKHVRWWLFAGMILVFGQIWIGGITRLTGSGLSITKWDIVTGTLPPMSEDAWSYEFDLYRKTPQYALINKGMSLSEFKNIYFWEYLHRLWARLMGFIFVIPFLYFLFKKYFSAQLVRHLILLVILAGVTASFGWIMVASGLVDRPWVNAYKLSIHLLLGFSVFVYLYIIYQRYVGKSCVTNRSLITSVVLFLVLFQIFLGGMMSGMRIGFSYPTWPLMHGSYLPPVILDLEEWKSNSFIKYDEFELMPALVQFLHRNVAYIILVLSLIYFVFGIIRERSLFLTKTILFYYIVLMIQIGVGIFTLLAFSKGLPVELASTHQMLGLALLVVIVHLKMFTSGGLSGSGKRME